jgi:hypothetical protein
MFPILCSLKPFSFLSLSHHPLLLSVFLLILMLRKRRNLLSATLGKLIAFSFPFPFLGPVSCGLAAYYSWFKLLLSSSLSGESVTYEVPLELPVLGFSD